MKDWVIKGAIAVVFMVGFVAVAHYWKQASPNKDDAKLNELREIVAALPTFPDFTEDTTDQSSRAIDAGIYKYYCSNASYDQVKSFYTRLLASRGWIVSSEENVKRWFKDYGGQKVVFEKGEFRIAIEYAADLNRKCKYSLSYVWNDGNWSCLRDGMNTVQSTVCQREYSFRIGTHQCRCLNQSECVGVNVHVALLVKKVLFA